MYLDGIVKRTSAGEVRNVSLLVAIGVNAGGYREILRILEGAKEDKAFFPDAGPKMREVAAMLKAIHAAEECKGEGKGFACWS